MAEIKGGDGWNRLDDDKVKKYVETKVFDNISFPN